MAPDEYQQAWQSQALQTHVTIKSDLLLKEVQRSQQTFRSTIFWRDLAEVGCYLLMIPLWFYLGRTISTPWTFYLTVPVLVWHVAFTLVDRIRHPRQPGEPGESLRDCVTESLNQVEHQIWLLRNVFWRSLLPFSISLMTFFIHAFWQSSDDWWEFLSVVMFSGFVLCALYAFTWFLNQRQVRVQLEPQRQELLTLLTSLSDETNGDVADEIHIPVSVSPFAENGFIRGAGGCVTPPRPAVRLAIGLCALALAIGAGGLAVFLFTLGGGFTDYNSNGNQPPQRSGSEGDVYPKKSPFAAVRWQESEPEVRLGEEWFKLVSLDELPASEIVASSKRIFKDLWRMRFEEDLVELLTRMGHPPDDNVTLVVQSLTTGETSVRNDILMTNENRNAIKDAAGGVTNKTGRTK